MSINDVVVALFVTLSVSAELVTVTSAKAGKHTGNSTAEYLKETPELPLN